MTQQQASNHRETLTVIVNGEQRHLTAPASVSTLLETLSYPRQGIAVAVNRQVVPRSAHGEYRLAEGDTVDIVQAVGGG
ncbi:sulfur carrier protein ThiS [Arhodomonas sp. AD133]|uniref:sulfur carrier protein ThiS n=1 Tax=Arhodomonas sp. AD133 TaxID=3415009 RepID=UPI003EC0777C